MPMCDSGDNAPGLFMVSRLDNGDTMSLCAVCFEPWALAMVQALRDVLGELPEGAGVPAGEVEPINLDQTAEEPRGDHDSEGGPEQTAPGDAAVAPRAAGRGGVPASGAGVARRARKPRGGTTARPPGSEDAPY